MWDVDSEGDYAYFGTGGIWEISVPSTPVGYEPKTALKAYLKKDSVLLSNETIKKWKDKL